MEILEKIKKQIRKNPEAEEKAGRHVYLVKCEVEKSRLGEVIRSHDQKCDMYKTAKRMFNNKHTCS